MSANDRSRRLPNQVGTIKRHLAEHGLAYDPATATAAMWGESFEGCVPGYGTAWAAGLGLQTPPVISFAHCVCDGPFMYKARHHATVEAIGGTDVVGLVFELADMCAAHPANPITLGRRGSVAVQVSCGCPPTTRSDPSKLSA